MSSLAGVYGFSGTASTIGSAAAVVCPCLITAHLVCPVATERTVSKVCEVFRSIYNALTFENVVEFVGTCCLLEVAVGFMAPSINNIVRTVGATFF